MKIPFHLFIEAGFHFTGYTYIGKTIIVKYLVRRCCVIYQVYSIGIRLG